MEKFSFSASASPTSAGTVSQTPEGNAFESDTEVTLTAKPNAGYLFVNWTDAGGNVLGTATTLNVTVKANTSVTANFKSEADYAGIFQNCAPYDAAVDDITGDRTNNRPSCSANAHTCGRTALRFAHIGTTRKRKH